MSALRQSLRTFTPEEYLELERQSNYKSEYLEGQIYAMSGGSPMHSLIAANITGELRTQLKGKPCTTFNSDLKVRTTPEGLFAYPNVSVVCGELLYHDEKQDVCINPTVIVEMLSPMTEAFDRGRKWAQYQAIASLQTYVLAAQDQARVEQYVRQPGGQWLLSSVAGLENSLYIASLDCTLALSRSVRAREVSRRLRHQGKCIPLIFYLIHQLRTCSHEMKVRLPYLRHSPRLTPLPLARYTP